MYLIPWGEAVYTCALSYVLKLICDLILIRILALELFLPLCEFSLHRYDHFFSGKIIPVTWGIFPMCQIYKRKKVKEHLISSGKEWVMVVTKRNMIHVTFSGVSVPQIPWIMIHQCWFFIDFQVPLMFCSNRCIVMTDNFRGLTLQNSEALKAHAKEFYREYRPLASASSFTNKITDILA